MQSTIFYCFEEFSSAVTGLVYRSTLLAVAVVHNPF